MRKFMFVLMISMSLGLTACSHFSKHDCHCGHDKKEASKEDCKVCAESEKKSDCGCGK